MDINALAQTLYVDEGIRLKPYIDTVGKITLGIGRNISDRGISRSEAEILLRNDIALAMHELDANFGWWRQMDESRQQALANLSFNLGITRLSTFVNMIAALKRGDYETAAKELSRSKWASQVQPSRSERIVAALRGESVVAPPAPDSPL